MKKRQLTITKSELFKRAHAATRSRMELIKKNAAPQETYREVFSRNLQSMWIFWSKFEMQEEKVVRFYDEHNTTLRKAAMCD